MDTTATIPTGAMAERWKWNAFVGWGLFCGALYYPLFAAWTWGGGWLAKLGNSAELGFGYVDFAGSGVVHAVGGVAALAGAHRPRASHRQVRQGRQAARDAGPQHPDGACSACSSCCSAGSASTPRRRSRRPTSASRSRPRTPRSPPRSVQRSRCSTCMRRIGKPDPGMMANGMLAGLVAITAPCAFVDSVGGGGDRIDRRDHRRRSDLLLREARHRRPGGRDLGARRRAASSACCASASSPTAQYGAGLERHDEGRGRHGQRRHRHPLRRRASASVSSERRRSVRSSSAP